ncbi:MAG: histidine kinase, partial [Deltaproteobacteria bacterium]|nr:histidine kinase [Deltaproteobacteria bacterium]
NEMVAEIQKRDGFLEEQVQQRTGDLQQAIDVLKQEMDERKKAEQKISTSLKEKDVLLKEIHHRVKNNLSVISSLLDLQADKLQEPRVDEAFRECKNRIRSMALIHNNMYLSESLAEIDFQDYVKNLAETLCSTYAVQPEALAVNIAIDKVLLDIDKAIPCGLIINELFTNALKYAFPGGRPGAVSVAFKQDPESKLYELRFCDDGVGLPDELDVEQTESLGLRIVTLLTRQLCGTVQVIRGGGTEIVIQFGAV